MLTDTKIRNAKTREVRYRIADSEGLYIEISTSGRKYWRFRENRDGRRSWRDLGEYPHVSLQQARELKNKARFSNEEESKPQRSCAIFSQVAEAWMKSHEQGLSDDKEKRNIASRLKNHI